MTSQRVLSSGEQFRYGIGTLLSPRGFRAFVHRLANGAKLLDVGCGNNSPYKVKSQRPDVYYIGLDVGDYNQTRPMLADEYRVVSPGEFVREIESLAGTLDAVISSHNIEHCDDPAAVISAIASALKTGGVLYMSFPSEQSVSLPSRGGCLNFHDDPTHRQVPHWEGVQRTLEVAGFDVTYSEQRYRPPMLWLIGALLEPISRMRRHICPGTWAFFGFESVIWATKARVQ